MEIEKAFPNLRYWARLPGFTAFCGVAVGICAAKIGLTACQEYVPNRLVYIQLLLIATIILAIFGCLCGRVWARFALLAVCGAALFSWSELSIRDFYGRMEAVRENRQILTLAVRITSPVASAPSGYKFRATVAGADDAEIARILAGKTLQCVSKQPVPPFGVITIRGRYTAPRRAAGPFGFDLREYYAVNNISGSFSVSNVTNGDILSTDGVSVNNEKFSFDNIPYAIRDRVRRVISMARTQEARGIFHAAFLGEREQLPESLNALFRKAGIVHLLAISGFHAGLLFTAVFALLSLFRVPNRAKTLTALSVLWCYLFLIGFIPSLFRATVMATFLGVSVMLQRKNHIVHTLGLAGFFWLCFSPHSLFAPGFQLSFAATAGIALLLPVLNDATCAAVSKIHSNPAAFIVEKSLTPLWVSVAASAATAPPLLYHFGTLSLYGILFNLAAIPLMSAAMWLFFAAVALSPIAPVAGILILCAEKTLWLMIFLAGFCEKIPLSEVAVPNVSSIILAAAVIFMVGLCAIRAKLRGVYALRAGAAAMLVIAVCTLYASTTAKTENIELRGGGAAVNVVIHKDKTAWIVAQGRKNDVRRLLTMEAEPLLNRRKVKDVPLLVVDEQLEDEAHELTFRTGFEPQMVVLRESRPNGAGADFVDRNGGYTIIDGAGFVSSDGTCELIVGTDGRVEIITQ